MEISQDLINQSLPPSGIAKKKKKGTKKKKKVEEDIADPVEFQTPKSQLITPSEVPD